MAFMEAKTGKPYPPHAVCVPFPTQGHINPMLKLAKLLHHRGFHITFVNTVFNHQRLLKSRGPDSLNGLPSFRFETIPDGFPLPSNGEINRDVELLCYSTKKTCLAPFRELLSTLADTSKSEVPPVTVVVSDCTMTFTLDASRELGIPNVLLWTGSACGFMACLHYRPLIEKGFVPLKDESYLTNGYLDTVIDWIPGMKGIRLKDLPSFVRTTDPDDIILNFAVGEVDRAGEASAIILNTFDDLDHDVLEGLSSILPPIYTIGPLQLLVNNQVQDSSLNSLGSNLWKEQPGCLEWLDSKDANSVVYVNFGSVTVLTPQQLIEFAWGLANSKHYFFWVIRPDLVVGESPILPQEFLKETKQMGLLASWCPQEQVLNHPSVGAFLTHNGWNSTIESICGGVPMICWPFFADQQTNCWSSCTNWGIGKEIGRNVKRNEIEKLVRELIEGDKGKEMKKKAMEWKKLAEVATSSPTGSSYLNLDRMINHVFLYPRGN